MKAKINFDPNQTGGKGDGTPDLQLFLCCFHGVYVMSVKISEYHLCNLFFEPMKAVFGIILLTFEKFDIEVYLSISILLKKEENSCFLLNEINHTISL